MRIAWCPTLTTKTKRINDAGISLLLPHHIILRLFRSRVADPRKVYYSTCHDGYYSDPEYEYLIALADSDMDPRTADQRTTSSDTVADPRTVTIPRATTGINPIPDTSTSSLSRIPNDPPKLSSDTTTGFSRHITTGIIPIRIHGGYCFCFADGYCFIVDVV